jgi:hypothetical protein
MFLYRSVQRALWLELLQNNFAHPKMQAVLAHLEKLKLYPLTKTKLGIAGNCVSLFTVRIFLNKRKHSARQEEPNARFGFSGGLVLAVGVLYLYKRCPICVFLCLVTRCLHLLFLQQTHLLEMAAPKRCIFCQHIWLHCFGRRNYTCWAVRKTSCTHGLA